MPLNPFIKKVLVIGSGPIVIGQAAEFDYAGTQACKALREEGIEIVLVNSNPATIMTDHNMADVIYIEPLKRTTIKRIIERERPDSILSGLGGQTGLTLCMQLAREGFLAKKGVRLLGSSPETIDKAEDRQMFKDTMVAIGQPVIPSVVVEDVTGALRFADEMGYPLIIRPAFTLGGTGGGIVKNEAELREVAANGLALSPITQILVEKSVAGWKEIEFEVMRDTTGEAVSVCSMENIDPVGVHTGDSIVAAPALTLSADEFITLRQAALDIIGALQVEGGCNVQFALRPGRMGKNSPAAEGAGIEYAVIEVNPRVSRSSALASKASGYPIARVSTKIAIGYRLDEIRNEATGGTFEGYEPDLKYIAVKYPKWPFDKFVYAKKELGTQMKATGEVMSLADTFELGLMKAVRGAELGVDSLRLPRLAAKSDEKIFARLDSVTDERLFVVYEALCRGMDIETLFQKTKITRWFLEKIKRVADMEKRLSEEQPLRNETYLEAKRIGFTDKTIQALSGTDTPFENPRMFKQVEALPYYYSLPYADGGNTVKPLSGKKVLVLGSGPIRIGQGIEFDYACVHCVTTLRKMGYQAIVINNNPETVSTDFNTADRLYFEPLHIEDVMAVIDFEKPLGVVVAFGGGTAIKLTQALRERGVNIIGTSADGIDLCEDRERFDDLLERFSIKRPMGHSAHTMDEALTAAEMLGYPVLLRPSYVLGGQNMIIAYDAGDVREYMKIILAHSSAEKSDNPVLIDMYISGREIEVDAICDSRGEIYIPGIMEHIERTGVHSGDSMAMYPSPTVDDRMRNRIIEITQKICGAVGALGLVNIQYVLTKDDIYVIEVNPRASRTVPYISKITGVPMCEIATRVCFGETLEQMGYAGNIAKVPPYVAVKVPVFSFEKLTDVDTQLGPEMKSTGEVLGIGKNLQEALYKGLRAAGFSMRKKGGVFISVRKDDRMEMVGIAKKFARMGFSLYATEGNSEALDEAGLKHTVVNKISESDTDNVLTLLETDKVNYIISTSAKGRDPQRDSVRMRRKAVLQGLPCLTSLDTANAMADSLLSRYSDSNTELVDINDMRKKRLPVEFTKMQTCGNDYIYLDCVKEPLKMKFPESLSVLLEDRHYGIGGDGLVLILPPATGEANARLRMFNLDGTEGEISGNALRCVAKYLYDKKIVLQTEMFIETLSGTRKVTLFTQGGKGYSAQVDMGKAVLEPARVPVVLPAYKKASAIVNKRVSINGEMYKITCVSMGNPHCVVFRDDVETLDLQKLGPMFENAEDIFPERVNVSFAKMVARNTLFVRVWERANGETLACGTGACASGVAAVLNNMADKGEDIRIMLPGGEMVVNYTDERVLLTGDCSFVYEGIVKV